MGISRRRLLRLGAAAAGVGALGGLGGCGAGPLGGGDFRDWLPVPGTTSEADHYQFSSLDANAVLDEREAFDGDRLDGIRRLAREYRRLVGVTFDETNWILTFQGMAVVDTDVDTAVLGGQLDDRSFRRGDYGDYRVYVGPDRNRAVAINDGTLVFGRPTDATDARSVVELLVDTSRGEHPRYRAENPDLEELLSQLGTATAVTGGSTPSVDGAGPLATGGTVSVGGDASNFTSALVFADASAVSADGEVVQNEIGRLSENSQAGDVDATTNGRTLLVSGTIDTVDLSLGFMSGGRIA